MEDQIYVVHLEAHSNNALCYRVECDLFHLDTKTNVGRWSAPLLFLRLRRRVCGQRWFTFSVLVSLFALRSRHYELERMVGY